VPGTTAERILGLRELYDIMCLGRDGEIEACLSAIERAAVARTPEQQKQSLDGLRYDVEAIELTLRRLGDLTAESAEIVYRLRGGEVLEL